MDVTSTLNSAGNNFYYFDSSNNTSTTNIIQVTPIGSGVPITFYLVSAGGAGGNGYSDISGAWGGGGGGCGAVIYAENYYLARIMTVELTGNGDPRNYISTVSDSLNSATVSNATQGGNAGYNKFTGYFPGSAGLGGYGVIYSGTHYRYVTGYNGTVGSSNPNGITADGGNGRSGNITSLTIGTTTIPFNTGGAGGVGSTNTLPVSGISGGGGGGGGVSSTGAQNGSPASPAYFVLYYQSGDSITISERGGIVFSNSSSIVSGTHLTSSGNYIKVTVNGTNYYLQLLQ